MKKLAINSRKLLLVAILCCVSVFAKAQGFEPGPGFAQLNFGVGVDSWSIPIYTGLDIGVSDHITLGPRASIQFDNRLGTLGTNYGHTIVNILFRGDYHFANHIPALPSQLDLYGGVDLGYSAWIKHNSDSPDYLKDDGVVLNFHAGGRWYWSRNWGVNAEFNSGTYGGVYNGGLRIGLSYIF